MVQIVCGQPQSEFCQTFKPEQKIVGPVGSLILLQPADIQQFISNGGSNLFQPGDHNFVSNSISVQPTQNQQPPHNQHLFNNFNATQQLIHVGPVYRCVPLQSNTATHADMRPLAGHSPAMTILSDLFRSPSSLPQTGPSPEPQVLAPHQSVPGQLQTIPLMSDGQVRLLSVPGPGTMSAHNNDTNSTVNYLVQPGDLKHSAPCVLQTPGQHKEASSRRIHTQKKGAFSKETISILKSWLFRNITHPYPTELEKKELLLLTGLSLSQLNNWLINSRRRMLKRLLSTLEGDHANFNSRSNKGTGGLNTRYVNMWKNGGVGLQLNSRKSSRDESEDENEKIDVSINIRKMSQSSDD